MLTFKKNFDLKCRSVNYKLCAHRLCYTTTTIIIITWKVKFLPTLSQAPLVYQAHATCSIWLDLWEQRKTSGQLWKTLVISLVYKENRGTGILKELQMEERPCTVPLSLSTLEGDRPHPLAKEPGSLQCGAQGPLSPVTLLQTFLSLARLASLQNNGFPV